MRCERAQLALSAAMDGEDRGMTAAVRDHAATCEACRAFDAAARGIRTTTRLRVAEQVPDLVAQIMSRVAEEAASGRSVRPLHPTRRSRSSLMRPALVAAVIGAIVGVAIVGGLAGQRPERAIAARVSEEVTLAAASMDGYRADYRVVEYGWNPEIDRRTFDVDVAFSAPERFRVDVHDATSYPDASWPRNDLSLRVDGDRWSLTGPDTCLSVDVVTCAQTRGDRSSTTTITGRPPFDPDAPMPTDIVLPVVTLAGSDRVNVVGRETVEGHEAVVVELEGQDAAPLFTFFQQAGSWRPVYATDRVRLWLDEESWIPLRVQVRAASGPDRAIWAARNGIRDERPGDLVLDIGLTDLHVGPVPAAAFRVAPGPAEDEGFVSVPASQLASVTGFGPLEPSNLLGLAPYRSGTFTGDDDTAILSYADGLRWLRIRESRRSEPAAASPFAQSVELPGGGVGSYLPAGSEPGVARSVRISSDGWDLVLESNLPREDLLTIAGSLPVRGQPVPGVAPVADPQDLAADAGFAVLMPSDIPEGMHLAAASAAGRPGERSVRLVYAGEGSEPDGFGIRVFESPGTVIPPPTGPSLSTIPLRGTVARWSADRHELEWVEDGVYVSVLVPGMDLDAVAAFAKSMERVT